MPAIEEGAAVRVVVDMDKCESNGICTGLAPTVFALDDDDELHVLDEHPPEERRAEVDEAVRRCPKQAITVEG